MSSAAARGIEKARLALGLTAEDLYVRYLALTGLASRAAVNTYLLDLDPTFDRDEHDKLVLAVNECFLDRDLPDRLPFLEP